MLHGIFLKKVSVSHLIAWMYQLNTYNIIQCPTQLELITTAFLCHKRNLSVVLPEFLQWLHITTQEISEASSAPHTPGNYTPCVWVYLLIHWYLSLSPCCSQWLRVWLANSSGWNRPATEGFELQSSSGSASALCWHTSTSTTGAILHYRHVSGHCSCLYV